MKWRQALEQGSIVPLKSCTLILIGETKEGQPFCYEDRFVIQQTGPDEMTVSLEFPFINPLEKLHHVSFIEFSYREQGMLYYALVDLLELAGKRNVCLLKLTAPKELEKLQRRKFVRVPPPTRTPVTCRIVGVHRPVVQQGVVFSGQILDISCGGMSFISSTRILCPLFLELSFVLPQVEHKITVYGEIVRVEPFGAIPTGLP
ncbi:PilZ domain-containing protein [Paenibacillus sp. P25]|nr:PilZ domain-containing protein [Paenibacillus sp. P25]